MYKLNTVYFINQKRLNDIKYLALRCILLCVLWKTLINLTYTITVDHISIQDSCYNSSF